LVHSLLCYPNPDYWSCITGLTSRPIDKAHLLLPDEQRLRLISGLDLNTANPGTVVAFLKAIPLIELGLVPQNNAMGIAQALAVFLSLYRYVHGDGAKIPFPGDLASFKAMHTDTSQDILTRFTIFVSLNPKKTNGRAYNIGNSDECVSWETKWSGICEYFGLKGEPPQPDHPLIVSRWIQEHHAHCERWVKEFKLKQGAFEGSSWEFLEALVADSDFDREYDLSAARSIGFHETIDTVESYHMAFDRYRKAKVIP
jgi:hypothetical protein